MPVVSLFEHQARSTGRLKLTPEMGRTRSEGASFRPCRLLGEKRPGRGWNVPGAGTGGEAPMHPPRNGAPPSRLPDPYAPESLAKKIVLLELVVDPPAAGDHLDDLRA